MSKQTIAALLGTLGLIILLYSLGRTKPLHKKGAEETAATTITTEGVLAAARNGLDSTQRNWIAELEKQRATASASDIAQEIEVLKLLSRTWNEWGNFAVGGYYAEQVAELRPSGDAWSIAASTYGIAFNRSKDDANRRWAAQKSVDCFRKAMQLEPDTLRHQINEAVMLLDLSSVDASVMPMEGVTKLRELDNKYPNNVGINMTLGRLSLARSGDIEKAIPRFENILKIHQTDSTKVALEDLMEAHFSLADCYGQLKQNDKALTHYDQCIALATDEALRQEIIARKKAFESTMNK